MAWTDAARAAAAAKRAGRGLKKSAAKVGIKTGTKKKTVSHKELSDAEKKANFLAAKAAIQSKLGAEKHRSAAVSSANKKSKQNAAAKSAAYDKRWGLSGLKAKK